MAVICRGPGIFVEAGARGRTVTSWPSLRTDIRNAGGNWVDEEVVVDDDLVTSRNADDVPRFSEEMLERFAAGAGDGQRHRAHAEATPY